MRYLEEDKVVLSVTELCELACRSGDIDSRYPRKRAPREALYEDEPLRRDMNDSDGTDYYTKVSLRNECRMGDVTFLVEGCAEGIAVTGDVYAVETVRRVTRRDRLTQSLSAQDMAELSCYGYFLSASRGLPKVILRVVYLSEAGGVGECVKREYPMTADELRDTYLSLLAKIYPRTLDFYTREKVLRPKARRAVFPYREMRQAQEDMIRELLQDMRHGETVFAEAPTGIGKTISTLYPAVRCFGEGKCDKIFYLTAKASTRREAVSAAERMIAAGTQIRAVVLSSKEAMCICRDAKREGGRLSRFCNPTACPYAKGYYDKAEDVISRLLERGGGVFTYADIKAAAEAGGVCPYELSLDLSELCEVVVCDYNYVFSPTVYLKRYFADGVRGREDKRYIFLVDEAHNLADRAGDMHSGGLSFANVQAVQALMNDYEEALAREAGHMIFPLEDGDTSPKGGISLAAKDLDNVIGELYRMAEVCRDDIVEDTDGVKRGAQLVRQLPEGLAVCASELMARCDGWLRRQTGHPLYDAVEGLSALLKRFCVAADHYDRHFATLVEVDGEDVKVTLTCLDPSSVLAPKLRWARSSIFFSATLTPADYFADILGGDKHSVCVRFDSPFPPENLCVVVGDGVSTRYGDRESSYKAVVAHIAAAVSAKKGNYMVFFPSYQYMDKVRERFEKKYPHVHLLVQESHMTIEEKESFIQAFTGKTDALQVGFCVLGGSFSEGLDLPGESLIGVIVVGVGIPGLSSERNVIKEYYDETREGEGYAYAYTYPGMNHVLQAAGRVIRRHEDKGVVVLLDDRYAAPPYVGMYPQHWGNPRLAPDPLTLQDILRRFWKEKQE